MFPDKWWHYFYQGTVVLVFQPAEEAGNGAKRMIGDGALENVEAIFAVHVSHEHPTSIIGSRPGPLLAGCGFFRAVITGKEGIVSREANPLDSQVVSVTSLNGGDSLDMIADTVVLGWYLQGLLQHKFLSTSSKNRGEQARVFRCSATVDFFEKEYTIYPPTVNDEGMYEHVRKVAIDLFGPTNFRVVPPMMGAEDFSFYSEVVLLPSST
ncbi:IAA-amino acid hydrolase ILR1-like 6 [Vitis vinifera]|uniref:IAA-amino acid hydrolase ILR1-like 6 n=1 Tax=Vitis vinifera TaxID=29760 RepID=A0A438KN78_VITVI|nr:IAA-amino acid hydrolase ILR1-like 6 [Vitis vinifera]